MRPSDIMRSQYVGHVPTEMADQGRVEGVWLLTPYSVRRLKS